MQAHPLAGALPLARALAVTSPSGFASTTALRAASRLGEYALACVAFAEEVDVAGF